MNTAKLIWLLLITGTGPFAFTQNYQLSNTIPVSDGGQGKLAAWSGGLNAPQLSAVHLDNDGVLDLVIYDRAGGVFLPFLNGGTAGEVDYQFAPQLMGRLPAGVSDWVLMRDFDADGNADLFTAVPNVSNIRVYRHMGFSNGGLASFALYADTLITSYPPTLALYSGKSDLPAIDDIDGDGDLDILTFGLGSNRVEWHKNTSMENTGGLMNLDYVRQSRCFGHFEEDIFGCTAVLNQVPCGTGEREGAFPEDIQLHAGSTILSLDLDNNGRKDLVIGDIGCSTLYALYNGGSLQIAHFDAYEPDFPAASTRAEVLLYPASFLLDMDNDGLLDLAAAPNKADQVEDQRSVQFLRNVGSNSLPDFQHQGYGILQADMIDMGTNSMPVFWDHNGDGLLDILVGGAGRYDSITGFNPVLQLLENIGTSSSPAYDLVDADYLGIGQNAAFAGLTHLKPTAGDIDGDLDVDLLLGCSDGTLSFFQNTAGPGAVASLTLNTVNYAGIDVGFNSTPQWVDLNVDGDLDLLIGNHRGLVSYYENTGTVSNAQFVLVTDTLGYVKVNNFTGSATSNGHSQPLAIDHDRDGDLDLLVGGIEGEVQVYPNLSLVPGASYVRSGDLSGLDFGNYACPTAGILDNGKLSIAVGNQRGGLMLLRDAGPLAMPEPLEPQVQLYPQPASTTLQVRLPEGMSMDEYAVVDLLGRTLRTGRVTGRETSVGLDGLAVGTYLLGLHGRRSSTVLRFQVVE